MGGTCGKGNVEVFDWLQHADYMANIGIDRKISSLVCYNHSKDEENMADIRNKADYEQYKQDVAQFVEREGLSHMSTGTWDYERDGERPEDYPNEAWFSKHSCEMCGCSQAGNREYLYAYHKREGKVFQYVICEDCVYFVNYGQLDDEAMERILEETKHASL